MESRNSGLKTENGVKLIYMGPMLVYTLYH